MSEPTPAQRAEYMIRTLENFIRDNRTEKGLSFRTWQALAHAELTNAFLEHERTMLQVRQDRLGRRVLLVSCVALVTVGFWGTVTLIDTRFGVLPAVIMACAGAAMVFVLGELGARKLMSQYRDAAREKCFDKIREFDESVKQLEKIMWLKKKRTKEEAEKLGMTV